MSASAAPTTTSSRASIRSSPIRASWATRFRARSLDQRRRRRIAVGRARHRQSLSVLRHMRRLPQRQAELLRRDRGAGRASRRRHVRADSGPGAKSLSGRRPVADRGRGGRVPGHRRSCRAPVAWPGAAVAHWSSAPGRSVSAPRCSRASPGSEVTIWT